MTILKNRTRFPEVFTYIIDLNGNATRLSDQSTDLVEFYQDSRSRSLVLCLVFELVVLIIAVVLIASHVIRMSDEIFSWNGNENGKSFSYF